MSKELFMQAHEQLCEEMMADNPDMTWDEAYSLTSDAAYERMRENLADISDAERLRRKEGRGFYGYE